MSDALTSEVKNLKDNFKQCKVDKKEDIQEVKRDLKDFIIENKKSRSGMHAKIEAAEDASNDKLQTIKDMLEGWKKSIFKIGLRLFVIIISALFGIIFWLLNFFLPALLEKIQSINIGG